ncbi:MAG: 3-deoxy-manno-octulosonate cytidylyltransferase [Campylobacter sp.]|nr:3-deoxy-manno-octulosonate cytidylyltransferase [Campylobacter sp.]
MILIPARLKSTRFENKILADIGGVPMFIKTALNASKIDDVIIAVDDEKVKHIAEKAGFKAVMTSPFHESGTDRINEAVNKINLADDELIINLQADEPFFEIENLAKFRDFAVYKISTNSFMASAYKTINKDEAKNPNLVKVICYENSDAIYFSRSIIPYPRSEFNDYKGHIGIYAYSVATLRQFCSLPQSELEKSEKLEQLRAISNSKTISMCMLKTKSIGIDTKEDLEFALENLN